MIEATARHHSRVYNATQAAVDGLAKGLSAAGVALQSLMLFGSHASGRFSEHSDLDLLASISLPRASWGPADNIQLAKRLAFALPRTPCIDLYVRTVQQVEEGSQVYGGVEYWAVHEGLLLQGTMPRPRSISDALRQRIVRSHVADWVATAARTRVSPDEAPDWPSLRSAMMAVLVLQGVQSPGKYADLSAWCTALELAGGGHWSAKLRAGQPNGEASIEWSRVMNDLLHHATKGFTTHPPRSPIGR